MLLNIGHVLAAAVVTLSRCRHGEINNSRPHALICLCVSFTLGYGDGRFERLPFGKNCGL